MQEYERVHRLNLEWLWERGISACSFDVDASPVQLVEALQVTSPATLAQLPLLAPDIGRPGQKHERHTRLVAHLAVAVVLTKGDRIDLNFGLPEHQASPRYSNQETKLVNMQLRRQLDSWLAALVEAAGNSFARNLDISTYALQSAARSEYNNVLGHKRLVFQRVPFQQVPHVVLRVNTEMCELTGDLVWHALRNIQCLDVDFEVARDQQRLMLHSLPGAGIHCLSLSGCDIHAPGMLRRALSGALRRITELESFSLGPIDHTFGDVEEKPLTKRQLGCLSGAMLRAYRIVSVDFFNNNIKEQVCCFFLATYSHAVCCALAPCCVCTHSVKQCACVQCWGKIPILPDHMGRNEDI
jgi:hypothetical protein